MLGDLGGGNAVALRAADARFLQGLQHGRLLAERGEVFGKACVVEGFALFPQGDGDGRADRARQHACEIRQAAGAGNAAAFHAGQCDGGKRQKERAHGKAQEKLRQHNAPEINLRGQFRAPPEADGIHHKAERDHPAHIQPAAQFADDGGEQHRHDADGGDGQPRPSGRVAQLGLQQHGQQHDRAHIQEKRQTQAQRADREIALFKQMQIDNRVLRAQFPHDEIRQRHHRHHRHGDNQVGRKPIDFAAVVEHELQAAHAQHHQHQPHRVDGMALGLGFAAVQEMPCQQEGEDADGHVDEENPAPLDAVADIAPDNRAQNRRGNHRHAPKGEGKVAAVRRIGGQKQALRQRNERAGEQALQGAEKNQRGKVVGNAAQPRSDDEHQHGGQKQPHFAEAARHPAGERHGNGVGHGKRGNHPCALRCGRTQVARNVRQGNVGNGGVQHFHEYGQRQRHGQQHQRQAA